MIKFIFEELSLGKSILNVTDQLIEMNVTNKPGKVFYLSHLQRIIKNEIYFGKLKFGQKNPIAIENNYEAIISEALWNDVQQKVYSSANSFGRNTNPRFTLSGLIYCGKCDKKLRINEKKGPIVIPCLSGRQNLSIIVALCTSSDSNLIQFL
ncbi:recombinase family protein [Exiguobacterium sp. K1]|uniref:recombinase family protein n=1 Tax=Exiguobacterium sp. K1 TaxID=2980105 RepID=UPI0039A659AB